MDGRTRDRCIRARTLAAILAALVIAFGNAIGATAQVIEIAPHTGAEADTFRITGTGWPAGAMLVLYWYGPDGAVRDTRELAASPGGTFDLSFVPARELTAPRAGHWMAEVCLDDDAGDDIGDDDCDLYDFVVR